MSQFEFIFVLVSIVLGLAITRLLDGLSHVLQNKVRHQGVDPVHLGFSIAVIVLIVIVWWALFRWQHETAWNFPKYLAIIIHIASFYALAAILYPVRDPDVPEFEEIRMGFYLVLAANSLLEILHTYMLGALFSPWYYLPFTGHLAVICFVGMIVRRRQIDLLIGWWFVAVLTIWPFLARFAV